MSIILDSGAYSAWRRGEAICLSDYIRFVQAHEHLVDHYINLDVIAGVEGQREHHADKIEQAAQQSFSNWQTMRAAGLSPLPVFHQGDAFVWLDRYLQAGITHLALSPSKLAGPAEQARWLRRAFAALSDETGQPRVRVHALGVTSDSLLHRFPWASVDSTTWLHVPGNGSIPVPRFIGLEPDFRLPRQIVPTTDRSRWGGRTHLDALPEHDLARTRRWLAEHVGISLTETRYDLTSRWKASIQYFAGLAQSAGVRLFFVTGPCRVQNLALAEHGVPRLLSYYDFQRADAGRFERVVSGQWRTPPARKAKPTDPRRWRDDYIARRSMALWRRALAGMKEEERPDACEAPGREGLIESEAGNLNATNNDAATASQST